MKAHESIARIFSICHPEYREEMSDLLMDLIPSSFHELIKIGKSSSYLPDTAAMNDQVLQAVYEATGMSESDIISRHRKIEKIRARHVYLWAMRCESPNSLSQVGARIARDHATVLHAIKKVQFGVETGQHIGDIALDVANRLAAIGYNRTLDVYNSYTKIKADKFR